MVKNRTINKLRDSEILAKRAAQVQGGAARAAVLGINDGLVSTVCLILGVAAATGGNQHPVLVAGFAGLIAGAFSMAAAIVLLFVTQNYFMYRLMKHDAKASPRHWVRAVRTLYGRHGFISQIIPELLDYFRPNFHPNDHDTLQLLVDWKQKMNFAPH